MTANLGSNHNIAQQLKIERERRKEAEMELAKLQNELILNEEQSSLKIETERAKACELQSLLAQMKIKLDNVTHSLEEEKLKTTNAEFTLRKLKDEFINFKKQTSNDYKKNHEKRQDLELKVKELQSNLDAEKSFVTKELERKQAKFNKLGTLFNKTIKDLNHMTNALNEEKIKRTKAEKESNQLSLKFVKQQKERQEVEVELNKVRLDNKNFETELNKTMEELDHVRNALNLEKIKREKAEVESNKSHDMFKKENLRRKKAEIQLSKMLFHFDVHRMKCSLKFDANKMETDAFLTSVISKNELLHHAFNLERWKRMKIEKNFKICQHHLDNKKLVNWH